MGDSGERVYGFDVQFILEGENLPLEEIKETVQAAGQYPLVVGDETLLRVHVHTLDPDAIVSYGRSRGKLSDLVIEDLDLQAEQKKNREAGK